MRRKHAYIRALYGSKVKEPHIERYDGLCKRFYELAEYACESEKTTILQYQQLNAYDCTETCSETSSRKKKKTMDRVLCEDDPSPNSPVPNTVDVDSSIRSPNIVNRKGRLNSSRLKLRSEVFAKRNRTTHAKIVQTTLAQVTYLYVNVANENQFNTTMSSYNGSQPVRKCFQVIIFMFVKLSTVDCDAL